MVAYQTEAEASAFPDSLRCYLGHRLTGPRGEYYQLNPQLTSLTRPQKGVNRSQVYCAACGQAVSIQYVPRNRTKKAAMFWLTIIGLLDANYLLGWLPWLFSADPDYRLSAISALLRILAIGGTIFVLLALHYRRLVKRGTKPMVFPVRGVKPRSKHMLFAEDQATLVNLGGLGQRQTYMPHVEQSYPATPTLPPSAW